MMVHEMHGRGCNSRHAMRGRRGHWEQFAAHFSDRWEEAQRGRGGRRGRVFDGAELRLLLLKLIADEPRHGYELIRAVEELSGGAYAPSPGVVYPTLTMLDEMGLIDEQRADGARKRFAATDEGRVHLAERQEEIDALIARLAELGARQQRFEGGPIVRAVRNLRHAVANRLERGDLSDDALHDAAALIDEVAQKIERLK